MVSLYVTSVEEGAGKTTICAGLGKYLLGGGKKVGFLKLVIASGEQPAEGSDRDARFMKQILGLDEPVESLCPLIDDRNKMVAQVQEAHTRVSSGKDVVIIEGIYEPSLIQGLDAKVIAVEGYSNQSAGIKYSDDYQASGKRLLGIVLNKAPGNKLELVRNAIATQLKGTGIGILGVLPEDRTLFSPSIGELADYIQGEILNSAEQSAELVENFLLGVMTVDSGPEYFGRKNNKAVVVRGDRPDMQIAALETATRCLVLCGNTPPTEAIRYRAETKKVPLILTKGDVATTMGSIEDALDRGRFNQEKKLSRLAGFMEQHFDFEAVSKGLGLAG